MYQAHFGLERNLFDGGIARESAVFMGPQHHAIAAKLGLALTTRDSVIVLTGPAGVGKTTLTAVALRTAHTQVALGWLPSTPTNGAELLEALLAEFGISAHRVGRVERQQMWRQFLDEMSATDTRVFVIAEHADMLEIEVLRALEAVTAADPSGAPGANLILLGQADLTERLEAPVLASLRQRVRLRQSLEPFSAGELEAYLRRRVADAGGTFDRVFGPGAATALHRFSRGLPRAMHNLCETALALAATDGAERVTAELVATVATEHFGLAERRAADTDNAPAAPTARAAAGSELRTPPPVHPQPQPADDFPVLTDAVDDAAPAAARRHAATGRVAPHATSAAPSFREAAPVRPASAARSPGPIPAVVPGRGAATAPLMTPRPPAAQVPGTPSTPAVAAAAPPPGSATPPQSAAARPQQSAAAPLPKPTAAAQPTAAPPPNTASALPPEPAAARAQQPTAPPSPKPAPSVEDELAHRTQTLRALASAKTIDEISNSMAETLFGAEDLAMLNAALASAGWDEDADSEEPRDEPAPTAAEISATMETPRGAFAAFGRQREPELALVDEGLPGAPPAKTAAKR